MSEFTQNPDTEQTPNKPDYDEAKILKSINQGWGAGVASTIITLLVTLFAMTSGATGKFAAYNDPIMFFDVLLIGGLAFGIYKKSRICAVSIFLYFLLAKIGEAMESGAVINGLLFSILFLYFYVQGIIGTFRYHKYMKPRADAKKKSLLVKLLIIVPSSLITLALFAAFAIGTLMETGYLPSGAVAKGSEIGERHLNVLTSIGLTYPEEPMVYFYSTGFLSVESDGNFFTEKRVVSYEEYNEEFISYEAMLKDVIGIEFSKSENLLDDSTIEITTKADSEDFYLIVSNADNGDTTFYNALVEAWQKERGRDD